MDHETKTAGEGLSDAEMIKQVAAQTSPDLKVEDVFKREAGGTATDEPVEAATGDEIGGS